MKPTFSILTVLAMAMPGMSAAQETVEIGKGAVLRGLDKLDGDVRDFEIANGEAGKIGRLRVELGECRYPQGDPAADAFAYLSIHEEKGGKPLFAGWMVASSPALNPLEHPRYDVWVLRCKTD